MHLIPVGVRCHDNQYAPIVKPDQRTNSIPNVMDVWVKGNHAARFAIGMHLIGLENIRTARSVPNVTKKLAVLNMFKPLFYQKLKILKHIPTKKITSKEQYVHY